MSEFDVIVIGGGPAGYPAAIRAAQNGLKAACIDEWKNYDGSATFGGTCLNAGCIPSKALLESSELFHRAQSEFAAHGIKTGAVSVDIAAMQKRRKRRVHDTVAGFAPGMPRLFPPGAAQAQRHPHEEAERGNLDERADDGREGHAGFQAENPDGHGDREFEVVAGRGEGAHRRPRSHS